MKRNLIFLIIVSLLLVPCALANDSLVKYAPINFNPIYEKAKHSVVRVTAYIKLNKKRLKFSHGSGFMIDKNGYGLTNNHVIDKAEGVEISFIDGSKYDAKIIGKDKNIDLAIFKIEGNSFQFLEFADSDKLTVGSWVVALGAPHNLPFSLTEGIVSAFRARVGHSTYDDMIQTSAAVNPGNSGGPLLDMSGRVIGINTVKLKLARASGIGFAISSKLALSIIPKLIISKKPKSGIVSEKDDDVITPIRGFIGARIKEADSGVIITELFKNYPAKNSGLRVKDIIQFVNGHKIKNANQMYLQIADALPEKKSIIVVKRGRKIISFGVIPVRRLNSFKKSNKALKNKPENKIKTYSDLSDSQSKEYAGCIYLTLERYENMPDKDNFAALDGTIIPMEDLYGASLPKNFHQFKSEITTAKITASATAKNIVEIKVRNWYRPTSECIANVTGRPIAEVNIPDIREIYRTDGSFLGFSVWNGKQRTRAYVNPDAKAREAL